MKKCWQCGKKLDEAFCQECAEENEHEHYARNVGKRLIAFRAALLPNSIEATTACEARLKEFDVLFLEELEAGRSKPECRKQSY